MPVYYTLKVVEIKKETIDTVTLCFKQPGLKKITYLPGQYLTLIFRINGRRYVRPYSFSSAPGIDQTLNITVKRVPSGIVSNHIVDRVSVGDVIEVMSPMGDFTIDNDKISSNTHIVLWGVGSGITPLMSITKFMLANTTNIITLVYGNRDFESMIFAAEIEGLQARYPQLTVLHFHSKLRVSSNNPYLIEGRIQPGQVVEILKNIGPTTHTVHYICGPTGLKEQIREALSAWSVLSENIYSEDFEIVKDPKDFEDVITRSVEVIHDQTSYTVEVIKGKSILEAGLDAGIELPYACQTGNCSVCKGKLLSGTAKMAGITKLPSDISENEYLLCCTYPLSNDIKVEA